MFIRITNCCTATRLSELQSVLLFLFVEFVIIMDGNTVLFCEVLMVYLDVTCLVRDTYCILYMYVFIIKISSKSVSIYQYCK